MCEVKKIGLSLQPDCLGGGIGRHAGLKIPWPAMAVRVRFPSEALQNPLRDYSERVFKFLWTEFWTEKLKSTFCKHFTQVHVLYNVALPELQRLSSLPMSV